MNTKPQDNEFDKTYSSKFAEFFMSKLGKTVGRSRINSAIIRQDNSKFAVMRSVSRGIKNVNITEILNHQFETVQIREKDDIKTQNTNVQTLKQMRQLYNQALINANKREKQYNALKFDNQKLKSKQQQIKQITTDITTLHDKLQLECKLTLENYQNYLWTKKSYQYLRHRLRNDKQILAMRLLFSEQLLAQKKFEKRELDQQFQRNKQLNNQTIRLLRQMRYNAQEFQEKKQDNLALYQNGIKNQREIESYRNTRSEEIQYIAEFAMQDKDNSQKNWKKLLGVHKFVKVLLRDKMDRQMKKFAIVEKAYQQIKTKTGVWQSQQFVQKFINRDQTYGNLLYSIAQAQRKIFGLKKKNQDLKSKENKLKDILNQLEKPSKKVEIDLTNTYKLISKNKQKNIQAQVIKQRLYKFGIEALRKIDLYENKQTVHYNKIYTRETIVELFDKINQRIIQLNALQIKSKLANGQFLKEMDGIQNKKNIRVVDQDFQQQDKILSDNQVQESRYVNGTRQIIDKSNIQFFKILKNKTEQKKKRIAQKQKTAKKDFIIIRKEQ